MFFEAYSFTVRWSVAGNGGDRFYCQILIKVSVIYFGIFAMYSDLFIGTLIDLPWKSRPE